MNTPLRKTIADIAERAGWTFAQAFLGAIILVDQLDATTAQVAAVGAVAAAFAVVKGMVKERFFPPSGEPVPLWLDVASRCFWTFGEVFLAALAVSPGDGSTWQFAWASAIAAVSVIVKGGIATWVGKPSAATLPRGLDRTPPYI